MSKTILTDGDEGVQLIVKTEGKAKNKVKAEPKTAVREPVHVVYGGADRFKADTAAKLGGIALKTMSDFAPNFIEFAHAVRLPGTESLPTFPDAAEKLAKQIAKDPKKAKEFDHASWFAWTVYQKTLAKLQNEPVEDFRIDFEDGYGYRSDEEEDRDAANSAAELIASYEKGINPTFTGIRVRSLGGGSKARAFRTLDIFLSSFLKNSDRQLPLGFRVTLPKVSDKKEVKDLISHLKKLEKKYSIAEGTIEVEILIETPRAIVDDKGNVAIRQIVDAGKGRIASAHFGAYDYTSSVGIVSSHQHLRHDACNFARQMMLVALAPTGVRLSDSVTTELPIVIHKGAKLTRQQTAENRNSVRKGLAVHFANVYASMVNGFYQSWDLHPNQLPSRYAAVYAFFLEAFDGQATRLRGFLDKASQAVLAGSQFDDAASAEGILNFMRKGVGCGAFTESEAAEASGMSAEELVSLSFKQIVDSRRSGK